jgi:uncharacterized protein
MKDRTHKFVFTVLKFNRFVLLIILLLTILFLKQLHDLKIDNDIGIWFNNGDLEFENYQDFTANFGDDRKLYIIYKSPDLFSQSALNLNRELTEELLTLDGVKSTLSLTNSKIPTVSPFGIGERHLIPSEIANYEALKNRIRAQDIFVNNIVSSEGDVTGIQIIAESPQENAAVYESLRGYLKNRQIDKDFHLVGGIPLYEETSKISAREPVFFLLVANAVLYLLLLIIFRNFIVALIPLILAYISIIWTMASLNIFGGSINMITGIIPLIILILSVAFSIHFFSAFKFFIDSGLELKDAIVATYKRVLIPGTIAALTTLLAFHTFAYSTVIPIKYFGAITSLGIAFMYIITVFLMPSILKATAGRFARQKTWDSRFNHVHGMLSTFVGKYKFFIIVVSLFVAFMSILGISKIKFESDSINYLSSTNPVRVSHNIADEWFDGVYPFEIVLDIENIPKDSLQSFYRSLKVLGDKLKEIENITCQHSVIGIAQAINNFSTIKMPEWRIFRDLLLTKDRSNEEGLYPEYVSRDNNKLRITAKSRWLNNQDGLLLRALISESIKEQLSGWNVPYYITGTTILLAGLNDKLLKVQVRSLGTSFLIILVIFIVVFRKPRYFLLGMLPNILPVMVSTAIMGFLGISMDVGTILIASITLGIAVDDTVYFLKGYQNEEIDKSKPDILARTYNKVWKPITLTSLLLSTGFIVLLFSDYSPVQYLGLFMSINIMVALISDLILLPSLLSIKKWRRHSTEQQGVYKIH